MEFDVLTEEGGVTLRGHVVSGGGFMVVRMDEPCRQEIVLHGSFFSRLPTTEAGVRKRAEDEMRLSYWQKCARDAERDAKTAEEWEQIADAAHRRIRALNVQMRLMREVMMGTAKADLQKGLLSQAEYVQSRQAFRDRAADVRRELAQQVLEQARARGFAAELAENHAHEN